MLRNGPSRLMPCFVSPVSSFIAFSVTLNQKNRGVRVRSIHTCFHKKSWILGVPIARSDSCPICASISRFTSRPHNQEPSRRENK